MNRFLTLASALLLAFGMALPLGAAAQTSVSIGPRIGLPIGDLANGSTALIGAEVRVNSAALPVVANASFDYYLTDVKGVSYFAVDLNAFYDFAIDGQSFVPYAGGGLATTRVSFKSEGTELPDGSTFGGFSASSTEIGLNLSGGVRFPLGSVEPFAQLNTTVGGSANRLGLVGGVLFRL